MATLELVEKLRQRANISYNEAKEALDASGDDILEAMIYLERKGKVAPPQGEGYYSSERQAAPPNENRGQGSKNKKDKGERFSNSANRIFHRLGELIDKCNKNMLEVERGGKQVIAIPLTVVIILFCLPFSLWMMVTLFVMGLFCGCRYRFSGWEAANKVMDSASESAENIKTEFKEAANNSNVKENAQQAASQASESFKEAMNQSAAHVREAAESVKEAFAQSAPQIVNGVTHAAGSMKEAIVQSASGVSHVADSVKDAIYGTHKDTETETEQNDK